MWKFIKKKAKALLGRAKENNSGDQEQIPVTGVLTEDLNNLKDQLGNSDDLVIREFHFGSKAQFRAAIAFIDGLVEKSAIHESILKPLMFDTRIGDPAVNLSKENLGIIIRKYALTVSEIKEEVNLDAAILSILSGDSVLFIDGTPWALVIGTKGWEDRGVEALRVESVIRGPRDGFSETLQVNIALIRRRIKSPRLKVEMLQIGEVTNTNVALIYLEGMANPKILAEVRTRLAAIKTEAIFESGYIEQFIEDNHYSLFPQVQYTERPDKVAANLTEGRIAIAVDGTPSVLLVPAIFIHFLQSPEDYYERPMLTSGLRMLRFLALIVAVLLPASYLALTTFHQEMLPRTLAITIAESRKGLPFPAFLELLLMQLTFELLIEAGIRLPGIIGQTLGIVGALIIGDAAVRAGLVSPTVTVFVALAGVGSFAMPSYNMAISLRIVRLFLILLAGSFGFFGMMMGLLLILAHLLTLRSFGLPYLSPFSPLRIRDLKDTAAVPPVWVRSKLPRTMRGRD